MIWFLVVDFQAKTSFILILIIARAVLTCTISTLSTSFVSYPLTIWTVPLSRRRWGRCFKSCKSSSLSWCGGRWVWGHEVARCPTFGKFFTSILQFQNFYLSFFAWKDGDVWIWGFKPDFREGCVKRRRCRREENVELISSDVFSKSGNHCRQCGCGRLGSPYKGKRVLQLLRLCKAISIGNAAMQQCNAWCM